MVEYNVFNITILNSTEEKTHRNRIRDGNFKALGI